MVYHLHSTMYLLNLTIPERSPSFPLFTFHYVSIKSQFQVLFYMLLCDLHSNMYLLNQ